MTESKPNYHEEAWLKEQYNDLKLKVVDIAKKCNVDRKTINLWLRKFEIQKRKSSGVHNNHLKGKNHPNWKGDNVGYYSLHTWVRQRKIKPDRCQKCGNKQDYLELANISGEYRRDITDYIYLCVKCHKEMDGNLKSFVNGGKATQFKKGEDAWNLGLKGVFKHTEETKEKIRNSMLEKKSERGVIS